MANAVRIWKQSTAQNEIIESISELSTLIVFKLADMVNIALEEGSYYKSQKWCDENAGKYTVEHN